MEAKEKDIYGCLFCDFETEDAEEAMNHFETCIIDFFKRTANFDLETGTMVKPPSLMVRNMQGSKLPLLLFAPGNSTGYYDPTKFRPIKNMPQSNKPYGGLWTSPFDPDIGSEWIDFYWSEDSKLAGGEVMILKIKDDAKFLLIDSEDDLKRLMNFYQVSSGNEEADRRNPLLDYWKLSLCFDGIYLTSKGKADTSWFSIKPTLCGWDCATVLVFDNRVIESAIAAEWTENQTIEKLSGR